MKQTKGFTLIELMLVVAIVGILSSIAYGYYGDNVMSANRTEGRVTLTQVAGSLEKCRTLYGSYNAANCNVVLPVVSVTNYYSIDATAMAATSFTLTASPVAGGPQAKDTDCTAITLTNTGMKAGTGADSTACW